MSFFFRNSNSYYVCVFYRRYHTKNCFGYWRKNNQVQEVVGEYLKTRSKEANLWRLVSGYHEHGHKIADVDPLNLKQRPQVPELQPEYYGLNLDSNELYSTKGIVFAFKKDKATLKDIITYLKESYCGKIALEVGHINNSYERDWLIQKFEALTSQDVSSKRKISLAQQLLKFQVFEQFLAKKFGTLKRYGGEGAENMIGFLDEAFQMISEGGISDVVLCMPHRGRLNLLTGLLKYPPELMFHKIKGNPEFSSGAPCTGDVLSHLVTSVDLQLSSNKLHITMVPNPSHLEAVNPVAMGKVRARMLSKRTGPYSVNQNEESNMLCMQVHGDASFAGQGIIMECFNMCGVPHFEIGGSLHLVINNHIGFTTPVEHARSSSYCSDIGKMVSCPVLHVNGDHPEEVVKACRVAVNYRLKFDKDVIVVMNCFRKWGHNELDDPSMTQPQMYKLINSRSSVPDNYWNQLQKSGLTDESSRSDISENRYEELNQSLKISDDVIPQAFHLQGHWNKLCHASTKLTTWVTGVPADLLRYIGAKSVQIPETFVAHSRLEKAHIQDRLNRITQGDKLDWSTAEALAVGSLIYQGYNVRISGQDVGRGTFSHRHMMLVDQDTGSAYIPLNKLTESQETFLEVANSPLSEESILGFEYGYSIESPKHLVIWEAQFGDFNTGAQVIIDTFVSSGEGKWLLQSGLVMLLPHGYDGAGPEHSSSRVERFLQMCDSSEEGIDGDNVNMHIVHPTTPAQYFHLLRRQMLRDFRKPLIVQSPKILLRLPAAVSSLSDMLPNTSFTPVIGDPIVNPQQVNKIVFCSGKHYYTLDAYRKENNIRDTALIRLELLCPFPSGSLYHELVKFPNVKECLWSQEEPVNMGPWSFIEPRFRKQLGISLNRVSRIPYGPPAVGVGKIHQLESKELLTNTFH